MTADAATRVTSGALPVAMAVALAGRPGLVRVARACCPSCPGFLGYVTGLSDESLAERKRHRMVLGALLFVLGFTVVFMVDTVVVAGVGATLIEHREVLDAGRRGARHPHGAGLHRVRAPSASSSCTAVRRRGSPARPLLGAVFGLGWAPCTGPTLGAVQVLATATGNQSAVTRGIVLALALLARTRPAVPAHRRGLRALRRGCPRSCASGSAAYSCLVVRCCSSSGSCS